MRAYIFPTIIMVMALAIAAGAAYFTIIGFLDLFGDTFRIAYAAGVIELGKIIAVSAIYQFRHIISWFWQGILLIIVLGAMLVTSMGIYGNLSSSYQKDILEVTKNDSRLELLDGRKTKLEARLTGMDDQIAAVDPDYISKRMELIGTFKPERDSVLAEIEELDDKKLDLELKKLEGKAEFGAIVLIAESVSWLDESKSMFYFIMLIIIIFDPMAIALTYYANVGFASAAGRTGNIKKALLDNGDASTVDANDNELLDSIRGILSTDKEETTEAIKSVVETVSELANDIKDIEGKKPQSRAQILDSARKP